MREGERDICDKERERERNKREGIERLSDVRFIVFAANDRETVSERERDREGGGVESDLETGELCAKTLQ